MEWPLPLLHRTDMTICFRVISRDHCTPQADAKADGSLLIRLEKRCLALITLSQAGNCSHLLCAHSL